MRHTLSPALIGIAILSPHQIPPLHQAMNAIIQFDPRNYKPTTLRLILAKVQEWKCSPAEAAARLLDQLAEGAAKKGAKVAR
jgi:hypothetical protein